LLLPENTAVGVTGWSIVDSFQFGMLVLVLLGPIGNCILGKVANAVSRAPNTGRILLSLSARFGHFVGHYCVTPLKFTHGTIGGAATCLTSDVQVTAVAVAEVQLHAGDVPGMCCFGARRAPAALAGAI